MSEQAIRQYLEGWEHLREMHRSSHVFRERRFPKLTIEGFLLKHGISYPVGPDTFKGKRDKCHECFANAGRRALDGEGIYCEGYVLSVIPIAHAWLIDEKGFVRDTTVSVKGKKNPPKIYFGVPFNNEYLRTRILETGMWGLLGDFVDQKLLEEPETNWRAEWPTHKTQATL